MKEVNGAPMAVKQRIAQNAIQRRKPCAGTNQQQWLVLAAGDIETFARGSQNRYEFPYFRIVVKPAAHLAARDTADVQFEFAFVWKARDRIAARKAALQNHCHVLPGSEAD